MLLNTSAHPSAIAVALLLLNSRSPYFDSLEVRDTDGFVRRRLRAGTDVRLGSVWDSSCPPTALPFRQEDELVDNNLLLACDQDTGGGMVRVTRRLRSVGWLPKNVVSRVPSGKYVTR